MNQDFIGNAVANVMVEALESGRFQSLCTLQQPDGVLIDAGQPSGNFVNVLGLVNIPCMAPPTSEIRIQAEEMKKETDIQSFSTLHVLLSSWYPQIQAGAAAGWRAVIDGNTYDLIGAESDSQFQMTRLQVRFNAL